jgi:serine protease Do
MTHCRRLAAKVSPAVVQITVTGFGPQDDKSKDGASFVIRQRAIGSGVILDPNRYIMTNAHVVEGAQQIRVGPTIASCQLAVRDYPFG